MNVMHRHHIIPKHRGGGDESSNIFECTVEQHAELHLALYLEHGDWQDWIAFNGLTGMIGTEECISIAQSKGVTKANSARVWTPEMRAKISAGNRRGAKKVICEQTGEIYQGYTHAAEELELVAECVRLVLRGKYKQTGGYTFKEVR